MIIGNPHAKFAFYLPTAPIIPDGWHYAQVDAITSLITLNGNHWRKIFTIMAKICVTDADWRAYRDHILLKQQEMLIIGGKTPAPNASIHLICGHVAAANLGITHKEITRPTRPVDLQHKLIDSIVTIPYVTPAITHCLLTPYLDYRQYPNALIELTRQQLLTREPSNQS